jgi:Methane/Phenol/Toluene Hydroxylase
MTTGTVRAGTSTAPREESAEATVRAFFAAYQAHDVERMVDLCAEGAGFRYVPFEVWARQRVLYGKGKVCTGKVIWTTLIDAFPDLANAVTSLRADRDGNVAAEAGIGGTQAKDFGIIACAGGRYEELADAASSSIGSTERAVWERNEAWQPAREALEKLLTAYDWGECFTAMNLVLRPTLDQILIRQLATAAHDSGDDLTWLLLGNLAADADRCTRWSTALARYAIRQRAGNQDVLQRWIARWTPRAEAAAAGLSQLLGQLPSGVRSAETVQNAANSARHRVLSEAGLAG